MLGDLRDRVWLRRGVCVAAGRDSLSQRSLHVGSTAKRRGRHLCYISPARSRRHPHALSERNLAISDFPITRRWPPTHEDRIQLYSLNTPNGVKVSIMLEET